MSKPNQPWKILPHGALTQLSSTLYTVNGRLYAPFGESTRRMSVVRLAGNRLAIFAPIPISDAGLAKIEALGRPAYLIVPARSYLADAGHWKERYPDAEIVVAPAMLRQAASHGATSCFDLLDSRTTLQTVKGTHDKELALVVRSDLGTTLIVNELVSNLPRARGIRGTMMRAWGAGPGPCIPPLVKLAVIGDRECVANQLASWAQLPRLTRLVMTQGEPIEQPRRVLAGLARELGGAEGVAEFVVENVRSSWAGRESQVG